MTQMPLIYLAKDLAHDMGVSQDTIYRYRNRGGILPQADGYVGRNPYWFYETVEQFLEKYFAVIEDAS